MKHIITSHFVNDKNKEGEPYKTKDKGKPFKIVSIKVAEDSKRPQEYDGKYLSCMAFNTDDAWLFWEAGDEVDIKVEKNGDFWNFRTPSRIDLLESRVKVLEAFMVVAGGDVANHITKPSKKVKVSVDETLPDLEEGEDIPF